MSESLPEGALLDRYRIAEPLGAGGMGEVYRAIDESLDRQVAIKILPPRLVANPERVRRFVQEAKAASGLSHPNIVTIHEIGQAIPSSDGSAELTAEPVHYIAMELVEGQTLRERIYAERPRLKELLGFLAQAAEGLAKAHSAGIVHRDLKPDNIMITRDGYAKVLDFGLAKLLERSADGDPGTQAQTAVKERTREGAILGTVGYMAPEQVQGGHVDHRADLFAFGCILYEAITRKKPFSADSNIDTMHRILHEEPTSIRDLAPEVPSELRRMVKRCLAKDPERRYQSMKDLAIELRDLVDEYDELTVGSDSISGISFVSPRKSSRMLILGAVVALVIVGVVAALTLRFLGGDPQRPISTMRLTPLTANGEVSAAAISPDGRYLAFLRHDRGNQTGYLKQTATGSEVAILPPSQTLLDARFTFTRDGEYLYVTTTERGDTSNRLILVPSLGGTPRAVLRGIDSGVTLSPDEKELAFVRIQASESHLVVASSDGASEKIIATRRGLEFFPDVTPSWSPDGNWIAAAAGTSERGLQQTLMLYSTDGKQSQPLPENAWFSFDSMRWLPDGSGLVVSGQPVEGGINQIFILSYPEGRTGRVTNDLNSYNAISLTADGSSLVTIQSDARRRIWKILDATGQAVTAEGDRFVPQTFRPLSDGSVLYSSLQSGNLDLWRHFPNGERRQLTTHPKADYNEAPTPDESRYYFQTERSGDAEIWSMNPDGTDQRSIAKVGYDADLRFSPDGQWLIYGGQGALWRIPAAGGEAIRLAESSRVTAYLYSPDGKWIAGYFRLAPPPDPARLCRIPAGGGKPVEIAELPATAIRGNIAWLADGSGIAFQNLIEGVINYWVQPLDGGAPYPLTNFDSGWAFSLEPGSDGAFYVSRETRIADAVLITDFR